MRSRGLGLLLCSLLACACTGEPADLTSEPRRTPAGSSRVADPPSDPGDTSDPGHTSNTTDTRDATPTRSTDSSSSPETPSLDPREPPPAATDTPVRRDDAPDVTDTPDTPDAPDAPAGDLDHDDLIGLGELGALPGLLDSFAPSPDCDFDEPLSNCQ